MGFSFLHREVTFFFFSFGPFSFFSQDKRRLMGVRQISSLFSKQVAPSAPEADDKTKQKKVKKTKNQKTKKKQ